MLTLKLLSLWTRLLPNFFFVISNSMRNCTLQKLITQSWSWKLLTLRSTVTNHFVARALGFSVLTLRSGSIWRLFSLFLIFSSAYRRATMIQMIIGYDCIGSFIRHSKSAKWIKLQVETVTLIYIWQIQQYQIYRGFIREN